MRFSSVYPAPRRGLGAVGEDAELPVGRRGRGRRRTGAATARRGGTTPWQRAEEPGVGVDQFGRQQPGGDALVRAVQVGQQPVEQRGPLDQRRRRRARHSVGRHQQRDGSRLHGRSSPLGSP